MANVNKVILIGNVTRDPEVKYTPKGTAVCELGLAINRRIDKGEGERREEVTFVGVTLWGRQAEIAGEYLRKGRPVYIEGRLSQDRWTDKETGQERSKTKVIGESLQLLGRNEESRGGAERKEEPPRQSEQPARPPGPGDKPEDEDIPF